MQRNRIKITQTENRSIAFKLLNSNILMNLNCRSRYSNIMPSHQHSLKFGNIYLNSKNVTVTILLSCWSAHTSITIGIVHPLERREHWPQKASCTLWREGSVGHRSFLVKLVWFRILFKLDKVFLGDMSVKDSSVQQIYSSTVKLSLIPCFWLHSHNISCNPCLGPTSDLSVSLLQV